MEIVLIVYLVGVVMNLLLMIIEESAFLEPVWKSVWRHPKSKFTWVAVLDKTLFVGGSFLSYTFFGVVYYISMWRK